MNDEKKMVRNPIRILQFTTQLNFGGVQTFLLTYAEHMDLETIVFDYVVQTNAPGALDERAKQRGSRIYYVTPMGKSLVGYMRDVYHLLKEHPEYKIVHTHLNYRNLFPLISAKLAKVKIRISHSHNNYTATNVLKTVERKIFRLLLPVVATDYWACSEMAGKWLYGNKRYTVIHNAIETSQFKFSEKIRKNLRNKHNIDNQIVWINVGMFGKAKNHKFLLELFSNHVKDNPNTCLMLCGNGEERKIIEQQAVKYGIRDKVFFLGIVDNVNEYLMMADIMIMPSLFEGLPLVCVEAQATGCPVVASSAIPDEALFADNTERCMTWEVSDWEDSIKRMLNIKNDRKQAALLCEEYNFDINNEAQKLQKSFIKMAEK